MGWQVGLFGAAIVLPIVAASAGLIGGRRLGGWVPMLATGAIIGSFALSVGGAVAYLLAARGFAGPGPLLWQAEAAWVALGGAAGVPPLSIPVGVAIDNVAALLFVLVTGVAALVHLYSLAYLRGDPGLPRYFATLALFCGAMLGLVAAPNLFQVFACWELVGFCSYLLIGFWRADPANVDAGIKAFLVNRVGDVGMLVALGLIWAHLGTLDLATLNRTIRDRDGQLNTRTVAGQTVVALVEPSDGRAPVEPGSGRPRQIGYGLLVVAGLGLLAGCAGKSAQFPLHVWLPDAMAGPTPVSALIHAATMVAAGVYLIARAFPILPPEVLLAVGYVGAITLLLGASIAVVQVDYKKVLAYSTISQLGFMMVGLGVGGRAAGLFHLLTHGSFKALLFLGAGAVHHAVHTYDMAKLGGLYRRMRVTALTMLAGTLAIAGVPLFSGFSSKDAILASSLHFVQHHPGHFLLFAAPTVGAALTAFYMIRLWYLLFAGEPRDEGAIATAHDGEPLLTWPLLALALPTVVLGWPITILPFFGHEPILEQMLRYGEPVEAVDVGGARWWAMGASVLVLAIGVGVGTLAYGPWIAWRRLDPRRAAERFGGLHRLLTHRFYLDLIYHAAAVEPTKALARGLAWFDRRGVDAAVDGSARFATQVSRASGVVDVRGVDGLVHLAAATVRATGRQARRLQTGNIRTYLMTLALAVAIMGVVLMIWIAR